MIAVYLLRKSIIDTYLTCDIVDHRACDASGHVTSHTRWRHRACGGPPPPPPLQSREGDRWALRQRYLPSNQLMAAKLGRSHSALPFSFATWHYITMLEANRTEQALSCCRYADSRLKSEPNFSTPCMSHLSQFIRNKIWEWAAGRRHAFERLISLKL